MVGPFVDHGLTISTNGEPLIDNPAQEIFSDLQRFDVDLAVAFRGTCSSTPHPGCRATRFPATLQTTWSLARSATYDNGVLYLAYHASTS